MAEKSFEYVLASWHYCKGFELLISTTVLATDFPNWLIIIASVAFFYFDRPQFCVSPGFVGGAVV